MPIYTPTQSDSQNGPTDMRVVYFGNELPPPNELREVFRQLHRRSKDRKHPLLASFLDQATLAIREEVRSLPGTLRRSIPPFEKITDFVEFTSLRQGPLCGSTEGILLATLELGTFICYHESHPEGHEVETESVTILGGLGIGLLCTTAVSLAPSLTDVPLTGAQVARLAWRLGLLVDSVSQNLQPRDLIPDGSSSPDSWAYVLPGREAGQIQRELDTSMGNQNIPDTGKVFISAADSKSTTISGPPAVLRGLFRTTAFFRDSKHIPLPVYGGLCHAEHLYNVDHVRDVVHTPSVARLAGFLPRVDVYSTSTGKPFRAHSSLELFKAAIAEILQHPIHWEGVVQGVVEHVRFVGALHCRLLTSRPSVPFSALFSALQGIPDLQPSIEETSKCLQNKQWASDEGPRGPRQSSIAIIGMSCRMPGATDTEAFWKVLEDGLDVHRRIPADRFDVETHFDPEAKRINASHTPYGCFIEEPGLFDASFFNMSPREAQQTDPMQRLALVTAYEALERSGYVANRTASTDLHRIGTFYGQASDDYREVNTAQEISTYFIPGGCRAFGPGRINYFFKFSGPSYSVDTACSSSLATVQAACTSLWNGDTDMIVAGGVNVLTNSDAFAGLSHGHFLSKTANACKTWDAEADGYCRADGVGSVVMKRLEDAEADNDTILGVILGAATNHSAEAVSITHPHAGHQAYLSRLVLGRAGVDPLDVSYVEMHGTGTQAGDAEETQSVADVFAPAHRDQKRRDASNPLYVGAVKANVGHSEAAAGITALLKVLLMLQKNTIPRHVGVKNALSPKFPQTRLHIPFSNVPWPSTAGGRKRTAVVNNFSAAGGNTTLLLQEAPTPRPKGPEDGRSSHVVAVSAKSKPSFRGNLQRMLSYLKTNPDASLGSLAYTTTARRHHHSYRFAAAGSDISQIQAKLATALASAEALKPTPSAGPPPVVFAFTGQGAGFKSANLELFHSCPSFRSHVLHLDALGQRQGFPSFLAALDGRHDRDHEHEPVVTQLAHVCSQIALTRYWASLGVQPNAVVGHSLGEYAALHAAGVLSASDAVFLTGHRALLLSRHCERGSHKMVAVRASVARIHGIVPSELPFEVACMNGPHDTVVSGAASEMVDVVERLEAAGVKCHTLDVAFAFHSKQTDPILEEFQALASSAVVFGAPHLPVISPLLGRVVFDERSVGAQYLSRATREPVDFVAALEAAHKIGTIDEETVWVEVGPSPVCTSFVQATLGVHGGAVAVPSWRRGEDNWTTLAHSLATLHCAGVPVDWTEYHRPFEGALRLLDLPTYAWNDKTYWIQYQGDWALTKGNDSGEGQRAASGSPPGPAVRAGISTSSVHRIIQETFSDRGGTVVMQSDLSHADFRAAAYGHKMNGCGVVTSSIHADIAFTLGEYLYKKVTPGAKEVHIDITDLHVVKGLVANKNADVAQLIEVSVTISDVSASTADVRWHTVENGTRSESAFASARLRYGLASQWLSSWAPLAHLVTARIRDLERAADAGEASCFTRGMAYRVFAASLVDYAGPYRGMRHVVMQGLEAFADVELDATAGHGAWTVPPHYVDSVAHLAGFVMNVSDALDARAHFCVTPGWASMRFAAALVPGGRYRSYVKMAPTGRDDGAYAGDVYVLQDERIVGLVGSIRFHQYPRILLGRFFSAPDDARAPPPATATAPPPTPGREPAAELKDSLHSAKEQGAVRAAAPVAVVVQPSGGSALSGPSGRPADTGGPPAPIAVPLDTVTAKALALIAAEAALDPADLLDDAVFAQLGIDSLMSLVLAEKFREQLGVVVAGSLFLEYPTIRDLRVWLDENYS